jgi:hypothetical protein
MNFRSIIRQKKKAHKKKHSAFVLRNRDALKKEEEYNKEAIHDGSLALHQDVETSKNIDQAIGANTDKMVNNAVRDTAQSINLDVQPDVTVGYNRDFSTTEGEVSQNDELLLCQSSTITNELRSVLKTLYPIIAMK